MKKITIYSIIFVALFSLVGCATVGNDFVRPSLDEYRLGSMTYNQVISKMGTTYSDGSAIVNGERVKRIGYAYSNKFGQPLEETVIPAKSAVFFFYKDMLVGIENISSYKTDNTNFDDSKVASIVKGKTEKQEVIQLFGNPYSFYIFPMTKDRPGDAIGYCYFAMSVPYVGKVKVFSKFLKVSFDDKGIVSDITYSKTGTK